MQRRWALGMIGLAALLPGSAASDIGLPPSALSARAAASAAPSAAPTPSTMAASEPAAPSDSEPAPPVVDSTNPEGHIPEIDAAARAIALEKVFKDSDISIEIREVDTDRVLGAYHEHSALNPASNAKIVTAAAALSLLHGSHRYKTTLSGTIKNGALQGPLILRGYGDPTLTTGDFVAMALDAKAHGVRRVDGDILVDQRFYDDQTTPPAFEQQPSEWAVFRAPVSAVAVNENTLTLTVRPGAAGSPAHCTFDPPGFVDAEGEVKTGEAGADSVGLALSGNGKRMSAKLSGTIGADARVVRYTRRVEDPTLLPGYVLKAAFEDIGVKVQGDVKLTTNAKGAVISHHESEPLSAILYALGKSSDNFYAEMVFKSIAGETKARPAVSADSAEIVQKWLAKIGANDTGVMVKNGSGLFDANRITASSLTRLLRHAYRDSAISAEFVSQLAVGGVDGTLHKRFRNSRMRHSVRAKTGTLEDAIALSGYVLGPPGKGPVAFSILFNKVAGKGSNARIAADKLVDMIEKRLWEKEKKSER